MPAEGSKIQVWRGTASHTAGGVTKSGLMKNKQGKIVSKAKHDQGKKQYAKLSPWNQLWTKIYKEGSARGPAAVTAALKKAKQLYKK